MPDLVEAQQAEKRIRRNYDLIIDLYERLVLDINLRNERLMMVRSGRTYAQESVWIATNTDSDIQESLTVATRADGGVDIGISSAGSIVHTMNVEHRNVRASLMVVGDLFSAIIRGRAIQLAA